MLKDLIGADLYLAVTGAVPESELTEIRLRRGLPVAVRAGNEKKTLAFIVGKKTIDDVVARSTGFSLYSRQDEIREGYIHYPGGIRIGVAGKGVTDSGCMTGFSEITSLNIRLPHEIIGCSAPLNGIMEDYENTLIVSLPFAGKTTLVRDMIRVLASRYDVAVIDERSELSGGPESGYDLGKYCDIIANTPKTLAAEGLIRAMSPEIIVLDELSPEKDCKIVEEITRSGIKVLASIHSDSFGRLLDTLPWIQKRFSYGVLLSNKPKMGSIKSIVRFRSD
jgi:stage III sporulation protein AA